MLKEGYTTLARHISDCGWGNFLEMLDYKAEEAGSIIVNAPGAFICETNNQS